MSADQVGLGHTLQGHGSYSYSCPFEWSIPVAFVAIHVAIVALTGQGRGGLIAKANKNPQVKAN